MPVAHQSDRNVQPTIQSPVVWLGSSQPSARPHEEFQDDIRVPAVQSHCKQTVCQFTENFRCVEAPSVVSSLLRTEKKLRLHFCSLSSKSIRAAFLPPRTSESNFLAAKTCYGGASIGGAVIPLASDVPLPSVVGRPGAFGTGLLGISTVSEPPHPLTAKSGIASSPTIKSGLIVFRMNLVQSVGKKNIQCQGNLATTYGSEAICQDPDSSARAAPATQSSHHAPP